MLSFAHLFSRKKPALTGLDISPAGLIMVELSGPDSRHARLERYARESLPYGAVSNDGIENLGQLMEAARRLWNKSGSQARQITIGIPSSAAITHIIAVAADNRNDQLDALAKQHADRLLPYPVEQALLDFTVIGPSRKTPGHVDLLIAAARREDIEDRVAVAESLGLQAVVADIDDYAALAALSSSFAAPETTSSTALLRLDAHGMHAALLSEGRIVSEQHEALGYQQLLHQTMHSYGLSQEDVLRKQRDGSLPDNYAADILAPYLDDVAAHAAKTLQTLKTMQASPQPLRHIVLAGTGAAIPGLASAIEQHAGIAATIAAPFNGMSFAPAIDQAQLATDAPACLVACGLALRRFDR